MLHSDITFLLALIALVAGSFLVLTAKLHADKNFGTCKIIGYCVAILSIIILIFTIYPTIRSISCGYVKYPWKYKNYMMQDSQYPMMQQMGTMPMRQHQRRTMPNDQQMPIMQHQQGEMMQNDQQMPMMQHQQGEMMQNNQQTPMMQHQQKEMMQNNQQMPMQNSNKNVSR